MSRQGCRGSKALEQVSDQLSDSENPPLYLESMTFEQWLLVAVPFLTGGFALAGSR